MLLALVDSSDLTEYSECHNWFFSRLLPQSKTMHIRVIGDSKFALRVREWCVCVCVSVTCDGLVTCPGCIPASHLWSAGIESRRLQEERWIIMTNRFSVMFD